MIMCEMAVLGIDLIATKILQALGERSHIPSVSVGFRYAKFKSLRDEHGEVVKMSISGN
jgi:hypothetical protein